MSYGARSIAKSFGVATRPSARSLNVARCSSTSARQWSTPLAKTIAEAIEATGPISIAAYMRQCLTSPQGGYYTTRRNEQDQFGQRGDFITSPEISQIFGELIGIWTLTEWMAQGKKSKGVQLVEVGPGRGTLMDDILRTARNFKPFASAIDGIYLIEASSALREAQRQLLCNDAPLQTTENGHRGVHKHLDIPIHWVEDIRLISEPQAEDTTPFIFAHEFFDALPIHAFQSVAASRPKTTITTPTGPAPLRQSQTSTTPQWRELLVNVNRNAPITTTTQPAKRAEGTPDFHLSLAQASNPSSLILPESSPRYKALKARPDNRIEISPESQLYVQDFARRIGGSSPNPSSNSTTTPSSPSGAALIIDYGPASTVPIDSLRGIRAHKVVSPFSAPGLVDISADVDFTALAEAALKASPGVEVYGPVEQGDFLQSLGGEERKEMLVRGLGKGEGEEVEKKRKGLESGWRRLVERGGGGMGKAYKVMAIVPESGGRRRPVGFGGGVGL